MKRIVPSFLVFAIACVLIPAAWAEIADTATVVVKSAVAAPVELVKFIAGSLKLIGEILLLPFKAAG